jgi:hypothetical protein
MKKILISIFFAFYLAKNIYGANPQQLTSEAFLELITADGTIEIEQDKIQMPIVNDSGYFTKGLSPCFCFIFFHKETGKTLFMTHFGPSGSEASTKKAKNYIESYLDDVLNQLEANYFASDSEEEEEDDEQHPLYESISIWVIGGKEADSGNSIAALRKIAEEEYFPVNRLLLNIGAQNQVLDVYSKDQKNTFYHLAELAEEQDK